MKKTNKKVIKEGFEKRTVHTNPMPSTQRPQPTKEILKESSTFELNPDDVGVIMKADGEMHLILPKLEDNENLPVHVQFMAGIVMLMETDKTFVDEVLKRFYKLLEERTTDENNPKKSEIENAKRIAKDWDTGC